MSWENDRPWKNNRNNPPKLSACHSPPRRSYSGLCSVTFMSLIPPACVSQCPWLCLRTGRVQGLSSTRTHHGNKKNGHTMILVVWFNRELGAFQWICHDNNGAALAVPPFILRWHMDSVQWVKPTMGHGQVQFQQVLHVPVSISHMPCIAPSFNQCCKKSWKCKWASFTENEWNVSIFMSMGNQVLKTMKTVKISMQRICTYCEGANLSPMSLLD